MTRIPASGRGNKKPPAWPLPDASPREKQLWAKVWKTPHAYMWEQLGWEHDVAMYCRYLAKAETGNMTAAPEYRQWSDRIGLNPLAMLRLRWQIVEDETPVAQGVTALDDYRAMVSA